MTTKFNVGDVVRLKSGGPEMTVGGVSEPDETVTCLWHDHRSVPERQAIHPNCLEIVPFSDPFEARIEHVVDARIAAVLANLANNAAKQSDRLDAALDKIVERSVRRCLARVAEEDTN